MKPSFKRATFNICKRKKQRGFYAKRQQERLLKNIWKQILKLRNENDWQIVNVSAIRWNVLLGHW